MIPPEMRTPTSLKVGGAVEVEGVTTNFYRGAGKLSTDIAVTEAVQHVCLAGGHLLEASFRLNEGDLHCQALDDLASDTSALVALWAGRAVAAVETVPAYIQESAREWRNAQGRTY